MLALWLALLPHRKKVLGAIAAQGTDGTGEHVLRAARLRRVSPRPFCVEVGCSPHAKTGLGELGCEERQPGWVKRREYISLELHLSV